MHQFFFSWLELQEKFHFVLFEFPNCEHFIVVLMSKRIAGLWNCGSIFSFLYISLYENTWY